MQKVVELKGGAAQEVPMIMVSGFRAVAQKAPEQMQVNWAEIDPSPNNPRTKENYDLPGMVGSYRTHGYWADRPIMLHRGPSGRFQVLRGHRRYYGALALKEADPVAYTVVFPTNTVPALVYEGLNSSERTILMMDHTVDGDRLALDEWSQVIAIAELIAAEHGTESEIAAHLGMFLTDPTTGARVPNRSLVQPRVQLVKMPLYIREAMEKRCRLNEGNIRWSHIPKLHKVWKAEFPSYPLGDGPLLKAEFEKLTAPKDDTAKSAIQQVTQARAATLISAAQSQTGKELVAASIKNDGNQAFMAIDSKLRQLEAAAHALDALVWRFGLSSSELATTIADYDASLIEEPTVEDEASGDEVASTEEVAAAAKLIAADAAMENVECAPTSTSEAPAAS